MRNNRRKCLAKTVVVSIIISFLLFLSILALFSPLPQPALNHLTNQNYDCKCSDKMVPKMNKMGSNGLNNGWATGSQKKVPIFFVTPTAFRPAQKADLIRLGQTLANVPNLFWIIAEDSSKPSRFIDELIARLGVRAVHLTVETPHKWKSKFSDPHWKFPRGVAQRNSAIHWIRENLANQLIGVVYFGDDDNTYDWRLFEEMRAIKRVGVWPVGIAGGLLAEFPFVGSNFHVAGFNAKWKPRRPFPIDMAGFAVNISLLHNRPNAEFNYHTSRGYLESHFLRALNISLADIEPLAQNCTKVYVWHTRTERAQLREEEIRKFHTISNLSEVEQDAIQ